MASKKPAKPAKKLDDCLDEFRTRCPITNELIKIVEAGDFWIGTTSLWTTRPYRSERRLRYELSYNYGKPPNIPDPTVEVVRDHNEPPTKYPVGADE